MLERLPVKTIEVVAAIIADDGRILATQRGYGDFAGGWEFPGGKVEEGETDEQALVREIHEELDARIEVKKLLTTVEYQYPTFHLIMHCYVSHLESDITLLEHQAARWVSKDDIDSLDWLPADIEVVDAIKQSGILE